MNASKPLVKIIATGGSIAGVGPDRLDYILYPELGEHITIDQSLARIPEVSDIARIEAEDLISVGSTAIGGPEWLSLANRINRTFREEPEVAGLVVTHGTATLEETAYFLHLTVKTDKPVVITGAMRPPTSLGTDADLNLLEAVRIAACPEAAGMGVLTVLNSEIHCGRDVTKANTFRVETFRPNELGFLGYADSDGKVVFYRAPIRKHTTATPFNVSESSVLPRVDIVYSYGGADGPTSARLSGVGELVVTELMIHPESTDDAVGEWVEIRNVSGDWLSFAGHRLGDRGVDDVVVSPVSAGSLIVGPGEFLTICAEEDYWDNGGVYCDGTFAYTTFGGGFALSNTEDEVRVLSPSGMLIDEVRYGEGFSNEGEALGLKPELASASDNDSIGNWCGQTTFLPFGDAGTPGGQNDPCW